LLPACITTGECGIYKAFTGQGKAVFGVEYNGQGKCDDAEKQGISRKYKTSSGHWQDCPWMEKSRDARMKKQESEAESSGPNVAYVGTWS
jgi:hypothetical protein